MRKVEVEIKIRLSIRADENVDIGTVINEMDYNFTDTTTQADIEDTEILDYDVTDSR